ncbi:type VI secretion system tube protein Hcp [bacterium]|nr:type VI secretion system tube protein Hcp [bacterium]
MKKISRFSKSLALVAPVVAMATAESEAAAYIKFDGVDGEVTNGQFEGYIKVEFFKVEIEGAADRQGPNLKDLVISLPMEKSSPTLMLACATGKIIPGASLVLTNTTRAGEEVAYLKIELKDVLVSSYSTTGNASDRPLDQLSLGYTKVGWTYSVYDEGGALKGTVKTPPIPRG